MFYIILTMFAGIGIGYIIRNFKSLTYIGKTISVTIYVMLFFLGVKIGTDENILKNLSGIGLQALVLALAGISGSVLAAWAVYRYFFKGKEQ